MKKEVNRCTLRAIESSVTVLSLETDYVDPSVCWRESESTHRREKAEKAKYGRDHGWRRSGMGKHGWSRSERDERQLRTCLLPRTSRHWQNTCGMAGSTIGGLISVLMCQCVREGQ